jgi:hypothetical protein
LFVERSTTGFAAFLCSRLYFRLCLRRGGGCGLALEWEEKREDEHEKRGGSGREQTHAERGALVGEDAGEPGNAGGAEAGDEEDAATLFEVEREGEQQGIDRAGAEADAEGGAENPEAAGGGDEQDRRGGDEPEAPAQEVLGVIRGRDQRKRLSSRPAQRHVGAAMVTVRPRWMRSA